MYKMLKFEKKHIQTQKIQIKGGSTLFGEVKLSGAKNAALPMIVAATLGKEETILDNVPVGLRDVKILIGLLKQLGAHIEIEGSTVKCRRGDFPNTRNAPKDSSQIRYSLLLLGMVAALGDKLTLPMPGGCKIGDRKYDLHLLGLSKLGALIDETDEGIELSAAKLKGNDIEFYLPTTSGTENIMIAATTAVGKTTIFNANTRPEVLQLGKLLNKMGAKIIASNRVITIEGSREIRGGVRMSVMPGWDEAVTYAVAAGMTNGEICIP